MKKVLIMILGLAMFSGSAMAAEVAKQFEISPVINVATFKDVDTTTGVGVKASIKDVILVNTAVTGGVNFYDLGSADLYRFPITVGYDYAVNETLTVTPKVGAVIDLIDTDNADAKSEVGFTAGADASFKVSENGALVAGVDYVKNSVEGVNLDGYTFTGGFKYSF